MENKKKEYTGMKAVVIEFNKEDIIATSGEKCNNGGGTNLAVGLCPPGTLTYNV